MVEPNRGEQPSLEARSCLVEMQQLAHQLAAIRRRWSAIDPRGVLAMLPVLLGQGDACLAEVEQALADPARRADMREGIRAAIEGLRRVGDTGAPIKTAYEAALEAMLAASREQGGGDGH